MKRETMPKNSMSDETTQEVDSQITDAVTQAAPEVTAEEETLMEGKFTSEDLAKARAQEKAKLYPQVEKLQEELAVLKKEREERAALEAERTARRQERDAARAAERKAQEEEEMSFKDLLKAKEQEFQAQLEAERAEREKAFALLEREREFQELQQYRQARMEQERDNIIPELIDLVSGNSQDEIETSIAGLKERSSRIFDSVAQVSQQTRKEMVGARITVPASGPLDNDSEQRSLTPEAIAQMSQAEYAKHRAKLLGSASSNRGQGLFG